MVHKRLCNSPIEKAGIDTWMDKGRLRPKLARKLQDVIAQKTGEPEATLGCDALRTYLLLIMRNATTDSPWPISNNTAARYNDRSRSVSNLDLLLWQLAQASTAAPTYFPPEVITIRDHMLNDHGFVFVDGGGPDVQQPGFSTLPDGHRRGLQPEMADR
jgi:uncharacterized protein